MTYLVLSMFQAQILVNMVVAVSTPKALSSVSVFKDMKALVVRWTSMNACLTLAIMMPPAWTRLEASTAFVCQVRAFVYVVSKVELNAWVATKARKET